MRPMWSSPQHRRRSVGPQPLSWSSRHSWLIRVSHLPTGLSVHMNQVHKESLSHVENALPNRQGLDVEVFGMEGVPEDIKEQHKQRIVQNYWAAQDERFKATGNPPPGQGRPNKKIKIETPEELKKRFAEFRAKKAAAKAAGTNGTAIAPPAAVPNVQTVQSVQSPAQSGSPGTFVSRGSTTTKTLFEANTSPPELAIRSSSALRPARLPELPTKCSSSPRRWIQPVPTLRSPCPTTQSPDRTEPATTTRIFSWQLLSRPGSAWRINGGRACGRRGETWRRHRPSHPYGRGWYQASQDPDRRHGGRASSRGWWREEVQEGEGQDGVWGYRFQSRGEDGHDAEVRLDTCGVSIEWDLEAARWSGKVVNRRRELYHGPLLHWKCAY